MKKFVNKLIAFIILTLPLTVSAQNIEMRNFEPEARNAVKVLTKEEAAEPVVILKDMKVVEYIYNKENDLELYSTRYRLIHINESKSVDEYNKIYIPVSRPDQLVSFKARTISKDGKVKEMLRNEMQPVTEEGQLYMSLAIEGVEKGSEVEYFYTINRNVSYTGTEFIQTDVMTGAYDLTIISPQNLLMKAKVYNSTVMPVDTLLDKKRRVSMSFKAIAASQEEKYANNASLRTRVEYKLAKNFNKDNGNLLTFADGGNYYYAQLTAAEKNETKDIEKAYSKLNVSSKSDEEKVRAIEGYLKTNFNVEENADVKDISDAIKNNIADKYTIDKLAVLMSKTAKVKMEIILTVNRYTKKFDPDFESWTYLDDILLYYPSLDMYMMPTNFVSRLGEPPLQYIGCSGLFIREVGLGDITSAVSTVKQIRETSFEKNHDNLDITISFTGDMKSVNQHVVRSMAGFNSSGIRPFYFYSDEVKKKEMVDDVMKSGIEDAKITNLKVTNFNINTAESKEDFKMEGDVTCASLIEKADNTFLFKVGAVIGPQEEMYQDKPRQKPVEIDFAHNLDRVITITIPDGYVAKGLDALNMNITGGDAAKPTMGFISSYKLEGNKLIVTIHEFYHSLYYAFNEYDKFRKVINASADFNKISIAFEKKS